MNVRTKLIKLSFYNISKLVLQNISLKTGKVLGKPTGIFISITNRCNLHCKQCDVPLLASRKKELSTDQWKKILTELQNWLGTTMLRWSGGEPFLREDMLELIEHGNQLGLLSGVITNGQLIDQQLATQIVQAGTFNISLSIDGMQKGHDFVRGDGSFKKVSNAAIFLNKARKDQNSDMRILVKVTIMETNLNEILDLIDWAQKEGVNAISISPLLETLGTTEPSPHWFEKSPLWVKDLKKLNYVVDCLAKRTGPNGLVLNPKAYVEAIKDYFRDPTVPTPPDFHCPVGHEHFRIERNGDVFLCPFLPPIGNLTENTPRQIWTSTEAKKTRKNIKLCRRNCLVACQHRRTISEHLDLFLKLFK